MENDLLEFPVGEILDAQVEAGCERPARLRRIDELDVFDHSAEPIP